MTALSHVDPAFSSVAAIEAINEPIMDANQTPGYGDCKSYFTLQCSHDAVIDKIPSSPKELCASC